MSLFKKHKMPEPSFPPEEYEPVIRCSICTGEQVACMRERESGRLRELYVIYDREDLERFSRSCGMEPEKIRRIY